MRTLLLSFAILGAGVLAPVGADTAPDILSTDVAAMRQILGTLEAGKPVEAGQTFGKLDRLDELLKQYRLSPVMENDLVDIRQRMHRIARQRTVEALVARHGEGASRAIHGVISTGSSARPGNPRFQGLRSDIDMTVVADRVRAGSGGAGLDLSGEAVREYPAQFRRLFGVDPARLDIHVFPWVSSTPAPGARTAAEVVTERRQATGALRSDEAYRQQGALRYLDWYNARTGAADLYVGGRLVPDPDAIRLGGARPGVTPAMSRLATKMGVPKGGFSTIDAMGLAVNEYRFFMRYRQDPGMDDLDRLAKAVKHANRSADSVELMLGQKIAPEASERVRRLGEMSGRWQADVTKVIHERVQAAGRPLDAAEIRVTRQESLHRLVTSDPVLAPYARDARPHELPGRMMQELEGFSRRNLEHAFLRAAKSTRRLLAEPGALEPTARSHGTRAFEFAQAFAELERLPGGPSLARELVQGLPATVRDDPRFRSFINEARKLPAAPGASPVRKVARASSLATGGALSELARSGSHLFVLSAGIQVASNALTEVSRGRTPGLTSTFGFLGDGSFWKSTAGVAAGAWIGSRIVQMGFARAILGRIAAVSPPGMRLAMLLPAFVLGAAGGELAAGGRLEPGKLLLESLGAAAGTVLAMSLLPGGGILGQIAGGLAGGWLAKKLLGDHDPAVASSDPGMRPSLSGAASVPPPAPAASGSPALDRSRREAYSRLVESLEEGRLDDARILLDQYQAGK